MSSFAIPPTGASPSLKPFVVNIAEARVSELHQLVKLSKIGIPTYENQQADGRFGISRDWLMDAKSEWEKFDWRESEKYINTFPHFTAPVPDEKSGNADGVFNLHFVALFSKRANAIPIVFLHGWPGSFLEFLPMLEVVRGQYSEETLPYHVIVPSLPGFVFSDAPPADRGFGAEDVARIVNAGVKLLGLEAYMVQGGDIGSRVARISAVKYPEVKAAHLNFCMIPPPPSHPTSSTPSPEEQAGLARLAQFQSSGSAYMQEHATRPATIGLCLSSSPLALLAWIGEKFLAWSDTPPSLPTILEAVSLYYLTDTFPRSIFTYREPGIAGDPAWFIAKPVGFSWFPKEVAPVPRAWVESTGRVVWWRAHDRGGHFAALERPGVVWGDVEGFVGEVWKGE
ncbi:alpha/beta-hydrolase [Mytilinidion resinicola]|uniref:Alpha/beta-hydrolase n=1 Tax=Mytilinidion resinicola TaxID=574789 RepID=A0A6A6XZ17_9PEZI|nr:alpha/beta-hydrolase [Mytilinidion resinicola]KAF2801503.1 alpha/beta-hydrolase [Mytilinidion resinicola]